MTQKLKTPEEIWKDYVKLHPEDYGQNKNGLKEYVTFETNDFESILENYLNQHIVDIIDNFKIPVNGSVIIHDSDGRHKYFINSFSLEANWIEFQTMQAPHKKIKIQIDSLTI